MRRTTSATTGWNGIIPVSWPILGLMLTLDQLLLPMLHIGSFPYKPSYLICLFWLTRWITRPSSSSAEQRDVTLFFAAIAVLISCALVGEVWLAAVYKVTDYGQTMRSILIHLLTALAFGVGTKARSFKLEWLVPTLIVAASLNFIFIAFKSLLPSQLIDFYYPPLAVDQLGAFGVSDVGQLLDLARPRGLFGNPNVSAFMVNVIALFLHIGFRHRLLPLPKPLVALAVVALPLLLSITVMSRGEIIVSAMLAALNLRVIWRASRAYARSRITLYLALIPITVSIGLVRVLDGDSLGSSIERAASIFDVVSKASDSSQESRDLDSIARPLITLKRMSDRFAFSPLFGSGFSATAGPPFEAGTEYFHNDWFRVIATTGLVGLATMFWLLWRFVWPLGWPTIIPFILPALVNTFTLNIPGSMFYWFMIAVISAKLRSHHD